MQKKKKDEKSIEQKKAELSAEIEKEKQKKIKECTEKVNNVLNEYGCTLLPSVLFIQGMPPKYSCTIVLKPKQ